MAGNFSITLDEDDYRRCIKILSELTNMQRSKVVRKGLRDGGKVFITEGKKNFKARLSKDPVNVKNRKGNLQKAFKEKVYLKKTKVHSGFGAKGHHAHLVDRGTKKRWTKKGAYRGSVSKGTPNKGSMFWTDAFNARKKDAAKVLMDSVKKEIQRLCN